MSEKRVQKSEKFSIWQNFFNNPNGILGNFNILYFITYYKLI